MESARERTDERLRRRILHTLGTLPNELIPIAILDPALSPNILFVWSMFVTPRSTMALPLANHAREQSLGQDFRQHCMMRANVLCGEAARNDGPTWIRLQQRFGRAPTIWEYICECLDEVLLHTKRPGQAAWTFRGLRDRVVYGFIYTSGCSEAAQSSVPHPSCDTGCMWWPIIWVETEDGRWPMYCPALAWQRARPWYCRHNYSYRLPQRGKEIPCGSEGKIKLLTVRIILP